ncbi:uncharacterized protein LOC124358477 [Homalodisca vitripennis]|uniref:uncharacterized protein LOC124358477 n=1 Tax=Homalodisca vitripennis TaxID=197043 RepID=UPI001EE9BFE7|nr:uncharacterized protein LOC124358477 [Homalodisca vitripennis]
MNELDVNLEIQKRKRKKGVLNKSEYKAEIIKKARVSGSSYISWTGKEVPEITPGEDCKCRRKCFTKVADEERKRIFETFRSLGSKNEQDNYLQSLIAATEVKQKRWRKSSEISRKPDRGNTFIYEVSTPSGKQQVDNHWMKKLKPELVCLAAAVVKQWQQEAVTDVENGVHV